MISIQNLHKSYGGQGLFEGASLQMGRGERLGLVGRNGHGKSTLFRMILGEEEPDEGAITFPRNYRIGHLAQHLNFTRPTILEEGSLGLPPGEEDDHYKVERILFGLGFGDADMDRSPREFSGGFQVRLNLAKVLVSRPNLLLLDEPTNYLDIVSIRWIIGFLNDWEDEMILISHDRDFMDQVTTHTAAIHRQKIRKVAGSTSKLYEQIHQEEQIYEKTRQNEEKQRAHIESFVNRFRAQATKASAVQSRIKMLEKMGSRERLSEIADLDFRFHYRPVSAKTLMEAREIDFHYDPQVPLIRNLHLSVQSKDRIGIIGKNGRGKSTLLNVLAGELAPVRGEIRTHPDTNLGYFGQTNIQRLDPDLTVEEEVQTANNDLNRTQVRSICGIMMFSGDHAEKKVKVLSGGEKSRVLLGKILAMPSNLLFLDEPTNHLDMQSIEALVDSIEEFPGAVVIVTHSEMILREIATKLVVFQGGGVDVFLGGYDEFLEKVGWEDETGGSKPSPAKPLKPEIHPEIKKEPRKARSEILRQQAKALAPLKKEMETLEGDITRLETEAASANQALIEASQKKQVDLFVTLSKSIKESQKKIEEAFERLEKISGKHDEQAKKFEALLAEADEEALS